MFSVCSGHIYGVFFGRGGDRRLVFWQILWRFHLCCPHVSFVFQGVRYPWVLRCFLYGLAEFQVYPFFLLGFRIWWIGFFWILWRDGYRRYRFLPFFSLILWGNSSAGGNILPSLPFLFYRTGGSSLEVHAFWREGFWEAVFCRESLLDDLGASWISLWFFGSI